MTDYYAFLEEDGTPCFGGGGRWPRADASGAPGPWLPDCRAGYRVLREQDLVYWLATVLHRVEVDPEGMIVREDPDTPRVLVRRVRDLGRVAAWHARTARLFAADCAERTLALFEQAYPGDDRLRRTLTVARAYGRGETDVLALQAANEAVAALLATGRGSATWPRGCLAVRASAQAVLSATLLFSPHAAWSAARFAVQALADGAPVRAAEERQWQTARLMQYLRGEAP